MDNCILLSIRKNWAAAILSGEKKLEIRKCAPSYISIAFQNDNPTQVDAEVTAQSLDSDGTLVIMDDELTENAT